MFATVVVRRFIHYWSYTYMYTDQHEVLVNLLPFSSSPRCLIKLIREPLSFFPISLILKSHPYIYTRPYILYRKGTTSIEIFQYQLDYSQFIYTIHDLFEGLETIIHVGNE